jgi:hypothetical protein
MLHHTLDLDRLLLLFLGGFGRTDEGGREKSQREREKPGPKGPGF